MRKITPVTPLILASTSHGRREQLQRLGLVFTAQGSKVDEAPIKEEFADLPLPQLALKLADAKAAAVAAKHKNSLVLGGDQMGELAGMRLGKPETEAAAFEQLKALQGRWHYLHTAVSLRQGDTVLWQHIATTALHMRSLTDAEIRAYIEHDKPLDCCGSYRIESRGMHLFDRIDGDMSAIEGLPTVALTAALYRLNQLKVA